MFVRTFSALFLFSFCVSKVNGELYLAFVVAVVVVVVVVEVVAEVMYLVAKKQIIKNVEIKKVDFDSRMVRDVVAPFEIESESRCKLLSSCSVSPATTLTRTTASPVRSEPQRYSPESLSPT